jgi:hypothetical protein
VRVDDCHVISYDTLVYALGSIADADVVPGVDEHAYTLDSAGGDINARMQLLAPGVTLWTDGGGKVRQALRPIEGIEKVAAWLAGVAKRPYEGVEIADMSAEVVDINGGPGIVFIGAGRVIATLTVDLDTDGRIATIHNVANPDKLHAIADGVARI